MWYGWCVGCGVCVVCGVCCVLCVVCAVCDVGGVCGVCDVCGEWDVSGMCGICGVCGLYAVCDVCVVCAVCMPVYIICTWCISWYTSIISQKVPSARQSVLHRLGHLPSGSSTVTSFAPPLVAPPTCTQLSDSNCTTEN